jgi:hypothetical protein
MVSEKILIELELCCMSQGYEENVISYELERSYFIPHIVARNIIQLKEYLENE